MATLKNEAEAANFLREAYQHCKTIGASGEGTELLEDAGVTRRTSGDTGEPKRSDDQAGVVTDARGGRLGAEFIKAIAQHRHWEREPAP